MVAIAVTVGRVDFTARIDGRRTPRDAENIGRRAGAAGAEGYDETWSKGFEETLTKAGQDSLRRWRKNGANDGTIYGREINRTMKKFLKQAEIDVAGLRMRPGFMDDFSRKFDDAGLAARDMQNKLIELNRQGQITNQVFEASKRQVDEWVVTQRKAAVETNRHRDAVAGLSMDLENQRQLFRDVSRTVDRHTDSVQRSTAATKKQGMTWGDIPHNGRQVILITAAIAAGAESIAVLGSAAGAGIIALGGAVAQFGIGAGAAVAVFTRLNKDLEDLPAAMRPVAREFQDFKGVFGELADAIAGAAFKNMGGVFSSLRASVSALTPAFEKVGAAVGKLFRDFAKSVKPGSAALEDIGKLVENSADGLDKMSRTAGTLGGALVRSFNRAQPLIQDLYGWIDKLVGRFDAFTQSRGFDVWISRAQSVFGSLGPLLDATGRALNNLVTPESTARTIQFLDNLTAFMPDLSRLLNTIGALDVFGLAAQMLADFGEALRPLAEPMKSLATEVSRLAGGAITGLADGFGKLASAAAPLVEILAGVLSAIPTPVITVAAEAILGLATAFGVLKVSAAAGALISSFTGLSGALTAVTTAGGKAAGALKGLGGKAGAIGLAATAAAVGIPAVKDLADRLNGYDENARRAAAGTNDLGEAMRTTISGNQALVGYTDNVRTSLEQLVAVQAKGPFTRWVGDILLVDKESAVLAETLNRLDTVITDLPLDDAVTKFSAYAKSVNASEAEVVAMLNEMPNLKAALQEVAGASGQVATDQDLVALAMGGTVSAAQNVVLGLEGVRNASGLTQTQVTSLADSIRNFGNDQLTAREAARQFEASLDQLTESIVTNGTTLDINTEQGRANQAAVDATAKAVLGHSAATLENTGSQSAANEVINQGRARLVEQMKAFGMTEAQAASYIDELGLIPSDVRTKAVLDGVQGALNQIADLTRPRTVRITTIMDGAGFTHGNYGREVTAYARGGQVFGPTRALIGEAGPEAVVPLNRPLSQVDPSVRWLSAIAQGKQKTQTMASGGVAGGGGVVIEAGAIVVQGAVDPRATAFEVTDLIAERIAS